MKRLVKSTKVPNIFISEGVDTVKISRRLGHANPKITLEFYAHLLPNADNDIADIFHKTIQSNTN